MCPRITWKLVVDLSGCAEHSLGTTALDSIWLVSLGQAFDDIQIRLTKYSLLVTKFVLI